MIALAPHILQALRGNEDLKQFVDDRIYFMTSPADVRVPFVAFEYTVSSDRVDKDSARDAHDLTVYCIADSAADMLRMADMAREALDGFESASVVECELSEAALQYHDDGGLYEAVLSFEAETI